MSNPDRTRATPKRENGAGSLSLSDDKQRFTVRVSLPSKKRRRKSIDRHPGETLKNFRRRAEQTAAAMLDEVDRGRTADGNATITTSGAVWIADITGTVEPTTVDHHARILRLYVDPILGTRPVAELTPRDVGNLDRALHRDGRSKTTRRHARTTVGLLMKAAHHDGLCTAETATVTKRAPALVKGTSKPQNALEPADVGRLLDAATGERLHPLIVLIAFLGLRRSEALGLGWDAVDLDAATVTIRRAVQYPDKQPARYKSTKTAAGLRTLDMSPDVVDALRTWRRTQAAERLAAGAAWQPNPTDVDGNPVPLVFTDEIGRPATPGQLTSALRRTSQRAGLPNVNPHRLRHSTASLLISLGEDVATVSGVLGHSSPAVTMSTYSHAFDSRVARATTAAADAIRQAR